MRFESLATTAGTGGGDATLQVWNPSGKTPVVAWMVGGRTVNGVTGEIIRFDVTGYNADWTRASNGLRALFQQTQSSKVDPWQDTFDPYAFCTGQATPPPHVRETVTAAPLRAG